MNFIGQQKIVDFFDNSIKNGRLAHAYCFVGPDEIGKRALAKQVSAVLLGIDENKLASHPDYYYLERIEDEKTGKLKKEISIAQARDLKTRLRGKSWSGGYQAVIIDEAELLNEESSNALLKILEEPGSQCIFFLLTTNDQALLPTIRSRCQMIYFSLTSKEDICGGLIKLGYGSEEANTAAALSWGRPGRAIKFLQDSDLQNEYYKEIARWEGMIDQPFYIKLKKVDDLFGNKTDHTDHIRERDNLQKILDLWLMLWRDVLLLKFNGRSGIFGETINLAGANNLSVEKICDILESIREAKIFLRQNIHPRLLLEQILLKF